MPKLYHVVFSMRGPHKKVGPFFTHEFSEYFVGGDEFGGPFGARIVSHSMPQLSKLVRAFEHLQGFRCVWRLAFGKEIQTTRRHGFVRLFLACRS